MEKSQAGLVEWSLKKAEEYLQSANANLLEKRMFPAAEDIFRAIETTLEAMVYIEGFKKISYPGREKEFTGRLALQFLIRDNLLKRGKITPEEYNSYKKVAYDLHSGGYEYSKEFNAKELEGYLEFAETLFNKARRQAK